MSVTFGGHLKKIVNIVEKIISGIGFPGNGFLGNVGATTRIFTNVEVKTQPFDFCTIFLA